MARPNMAAYFKARIDIHVNGMMARTHATRPANVTRIDGDVTDPVITVHMRDGSTWQWSGGGYASRKVNGCYAPTMPKPIHSKG